MTRRRSAVRWLGALSLVLAFASTATLDANNSRSGTSAKTSHAKTAKASKAPKPPGSKKARASVPRDVKGKIQRSDAARHAYARQTG